MEIGLVSVILPNRDHAQYLAHALAAFRAQTWNAFEVIVIDDASTDDSCALVEQLSGEDKRIKLLRLDRHAGVNAAAARGLAEAHGEFLYCAAADDWVAPEFFERSVAMLCAHPATAFCFSDPMEDRGKRRAFPLFLSRAPRTLTADEMFFELRRNYFHISSNTILFRRDLFQQAGGFRPDLHWLSDWFINNLLALRHGAGYLPEALTCLTVRDDSYSAVNLRRRAAQRELIMQVLDLLAEPEFADVRSRFRDAGLFPEYRLRDLAWLLAEPRHWQYLTALLVSRIIGRGLWSYLRPLIPVSVRHLLRQLSSARQGKLAPEPRQTTEI